MTNLIKADLYRIFNKKGLYIFSGICSVLFLVMMYLVHYPSFGYNDYVSFIQMLSSFIGIIIGTFVVGLVYNDDLRSKSLQSAIGFGMKRSQIVITKFIIALIMYSMITLGFLALIESVPYMFAIPVESKMHNVLLMIFLGEVLKGIVYMALTSIVVFATQKTTIVTTIYLLLATQTISGILSMVLGMDFVVNLVGNTTQYIPTNAITELTAQLISNTVPSKGLIVFTLSIVGSLLVSIGLFGKKELEF